MCEKMDQTFAKSCFSPTLRQAVTETHMSVNTLIDPFMTDFNEHFD